MEQKKGWVGHLGEEQFSLKEAVGGTRGVLESLLPGLLFVILFVTTGKLGLTLAVSVGASVLFVVLRLFSKQPVIQSLSGLLGVGVGLIWAAFSGRAENFFAWGLIVNGAFLLIFLASVLSRRPVVLLVVQRLWPAEFQAATSQERKVFRKRAVLATWVWVIVFGLRLAAQAPLYFSSQVAYLGTVKLVLGLPLFALGSWLTWILLRRVLPTAADVNGSSPLVEDAVDGLDVHRE